MISTESEATPENKAIAGTHLVSPTSEKNGLEVSFLELFLSGAVPEILCK